MNWPSPDSYPYDDRPTRYEHYDPYEPYEQMGRHERLRHLVFLDGRLVDTWTERVEGTRYQPMAEEIDRERRPVRPVPPPSPPQYEQVLTWLDGVVGGRRALLALDDEPLVDASTPSDDPVDEMLRRVAGDLFDAEFLVAARRLVAMVRHADAGWPASVSDDELAAGVSWVVGRANGLVGQGTAVSQAVLKRVLGRSANPSHRMSLIRSIVHGLRPPPGLRPRECPDLVELGEVTLLTSRTRRRLIRLRDRALEVAEDVEADRRAREALNP